MKKWIYSLLCLSLLHVSYADVSSLAHVAEPTTPKNIQILLEKDATEVLLEVKGPYYLLNPHDGSRISSGLLGKRFIVRELENGLKWGEEFPGVHQFYIKPRSSETSIFVNGIQYAGGIAVFGVAGLVHVVNELDIESYVKSSLTSQFPTPLEPEVFSALAILMRTDAYYHATKNQSFFWHVTAEETGYLGCALVVPDSPVEKAVDSTKHLILVHPHGGHNLPFGTAWTENSAGKTASYETMFRKDSSAPEKGVEAPHAALTRLESKWSYKISKKSLSNLVDLGPVQTIETFIDPASNKVYGIRLNDGKTSQDLDFFAIQQLLGKTNLLSSDFTVTVKDDSVVFSGYGKGHGAGLCLYSASALAQNGENAVKILSKFFPETYLYNVNAHPTRVR